MGPEDPWMSRGGGGSPGGRVPKEGVQAVAWATRGNTEDAVGF